MPKPNKLNDNPWRAAALVGALGIDFAVCIFAGYWVGEWLRNWTNGHQLWIVLGIILGVAIGVVSVVYLIKEFTEEPRE